MDWQKNRLVIALGVLVATGALAFWAMRSNTGDSTAATEAVAELPELEEEDVTSLVITRHTDDGDETVRLERRDDVWWVTEPVEARADAGAVSTVLDKLTDLDVVQIAARRAQHHEVLEVDEAQGVHVVVGGADGELANLWIGAFRSGNTMVRQDGHDEVVAVQGSIKFAFNKPLRDWRDRGMLALDAGDVREVSFVNSHGTFSFRRPLSAAPAPSEDDDAEGEDAEGEDDDAEGDDEDEGPSLGDWEIAEVSYFPPPPAEGEEVDAGRPRPAAAPVEPVALATIDDFGASKVRTLVSTFARMRASDFAAADVTAETAGIGAESPRVTLVTVEGSTRTEHVIRLGREFNEESHEFYAMREGDETIYVVSRYLAEKLDPDHTAFQASTVSAPPPPGETGEPGGGLVMPEGLPGMPGGGSLPPEVMEQIRRQLEASGAGGGGGGGHP